MAAVALSVYLIAMSCRTPLIYTAAFGIDEAALPPGLPSYIAPLTVWLKNDPFHAPDLI